MRVSVALVGRRRSTWPSRRAGTWPRRERGQRADNQGKKRRLDLALSRQEPRRSGKRPVAPQAECQLRMGASTRTEAVAT